MTYKMKDLQPLTIETATGRSKEILSATKEKLGFTPNMYANMANAPALLDAYVSSYNAFRADKAFTSSEQEVIFLVVSRENGCNYCIAAHSLIADMMSGVPKDVTNAIRDGKTIGDPKLAALAAFTEKMSLSRGNPSDADVAAFKAAGYDERHILLVILAISIKTLSNYSNHVFKTPVDAAFAARAWRKDD